MADRHNLITNPSFEVDTVGWMSTESTPSTTPSGLSIAGTAIGFIEAQTSGTSSFHTDDASKIPVSPGDVYTNSVYIVRGAGNGTGDVHCDLDWFDASDAYISSSTGTFTAVPESTFRHIFSTGTAPAGAAFLRPLWVRFDSTVSGDVCYMDAAMLEESDTLSPYFDGDSDNASWDGPAHNSRSTLTDTGSYRIWPVANPVTTVFESADDFNVGNEFYVTEQAWLTIVWYYIAGPGVAPDSIGVYEVDSAASGTAVPGTFWSVAASVTAPAWQGWLLPEPVELTPNQRYRATVWNTSGDLSFTFDYWQPGFDGGEGRSNGPLVMPGEADVTGTDGTEGPQSSFANSLSYPTNRFGGNLWVDVTVTTQEPLTFPEFRAGQALKASDMLSFDETYRAGQKLRASDLDDLSALTFAPGQKLRAVDLRALADELT